MTDSEETEIALTAIYTDALTLAAIPLKKIEAENTSEEDVDRGVRCARTLVITAKEVNALQSRSEKDDLADDTATNFSLPTDDQLEQIRRKVVAGIERDEQGKESAVDDECGSEELEPGGGAS